MTPQEFITQIQEKFKALDTSRKVGLVAMVALAIAAMTVSMMWAMAPTYQYLFTNLDETDASLILQNLKENRIPYKLVKGGTAIQIPEKQVYETRLQLAAQGLPKGGTGDGFSIFDETGFSTSEFVQKINYQRALQNELAKTISSMDEIDYARVHIVLPKESVFIEDEQPAKASIVLQPRAGKRLNANQVQGIVFLVAKSVRGLDQQNISIVDVRGRVLYEGQDEESAAAFASNRLEIKSTTESMLERRAQEILEKIVGPGGAIVKVSATVNMDMIKSVRDEYDPELQVVRSEELNSKFAGSDGNVGGIPGTQSNLPTGRGGAMNIPDSADSGSSNIIRNYEISRNQTEIIQSPGEISRLTISVVVDGTYTKDEDGKSVFQPRSDAELRTIEEAVKNAVGYSADREDLISVSSMPFAQGDMQMASASIKTRLQDSLMDSVRYIPAAIIILIVLLFIVRPIMKWFTVSAKPEEKPSPEQAEAQLTAAEEERARKELERETNKVKALSMTEDMREVIQNEREVIEIIKDNDSASATAVIKAWLQENG